MIDDAPYSGLDHSYKVVQNKTCHGIDLLEDLEKNLRPLPREVVNWILFCIKWSTRFIGKIGKFLGQGSIPRCHVELFLDYKTNTIIVPKFSSDTTAMAFLERC